MTDLKYHRPLWLEDLRVDPNAVFTDEQRRLARDLLAFFAGDPRLWTRHAAARDQTGARLHLPDNPRACCWCITGALMLVRPDNWQSEWMLLQRALAVYYGIDKANLVEWNDLECTQYAQVEAFLHAVAA